VAANNLYNQQIVVFFVHNEMWRPKTVPLVTSIGDKIAIIAILVTEWLLSMAVSCSTKVDNVPAFPSLTHEIWETLKHWIFRPGQLSWLASVEGRASVSCVLCLKKEG